MNIDWCTMEAMMGLLGTYHTSEDRSVWVTKTHYPGGYGNEAHFNAQKLITIVRNPIDAIPSFANLSQLKSHSLQPVEKYHIDFPEWWNDWVNCQSARMAENHEIMMGQIAKEIPSFVCRFEDLKLDPGRTLTDLFCFLLDVPDLDGTVCEQRIRFAYKQDKNQKTVYKLKTESKSLNRNGDMYTEEQRAILRKNLRDYNHFCGYAKDLEQRQHTGDYDDEDAVDDDGDNATAFFFYKDATPDDQDLPVHKQMKGYAKMNEETLKKINEKHPHFNFKFAEKPKSDIKMVPSLSENLHIKK